jgi:signal transduction histidine kinase
LGWRLRSVRGRLLVGLVIVSALGMAAGGAATFLIQRERILSNADSRLLSRVEAARLVVLGSSNSRPTDPTAANVTPLPFTTGSEALRAVVGRVLPDSHESSLGIVDGRATFIPGIPTSFSLTAIPSLVSTAVRAVSDGHTHIGTLASPRGPIRYVATPVGVAGNADRGIYVAAIDLNAELADVTASFTTYWIAIAVAIVVIASTGWFVAGRLLSPLRSLRLAASRVTSANRSERIPVVGRDDLAHLTRTVNLMLDRLDQGLTDKRQLLDDVRHELHTPVTIVRGHLEILDPFDPAEVSTTRALAIEELDRITDLIEDLAVLAESQRADPALSPVDAGPFSERVFAKASVLPRHEWILAETALTTVSMDQGRITQAWLQLVDNASKYSPEGSRIELGSTLHGEAIEFWVADRGPGIPAEAADRIFARFGRVDSGRGIAGSGLGLPIVKAIAQAHGGDVSFVSSPEGTRFSIILPRNHAPEPVEARA